MSSNLPQPANKPLRRRAVRGRDGVVHHEVRIDGKLEGEIFTKDTLVVGESATVKATVHAGILVVGGTVQGNITAEKKVELHSSARLYGNISTPSLSIAEGVIFEGSCTMGKKQERPEARNPVLEMKEPAEKILTK